MAPTSAKIGDPLALMERIRAGDASAMDEVLRRWWRPLVAYADTILGCSDLSEDVVQDVMLNFWQVRESWTPTDRLQALLYRMTRNRALNAGRWRRTRDRYLARIPLLGLGSDAPSPEHVVESERLSRDIERVIARLPPRRREVFILARFHGLRYAEIAELLDISPQTVANQLSHALRTLRKELRSVHDDWFGIE